MYIFLETNLPFYLYRTHLCLKIELFTNYIHDCSIMSNILCENLLIAIIFTDIHYTYVAIFS